MSNTTWRIGITASLTRNGETWADVECCTLDDAGLDYVFDDGFGGAGGPPFTVWTKMHVYFPACYDGSEWVASVERNPGENPQPTHHIGDG